MPAPVKPMVHPEKFSRALRRPRRRRSEPVLRGLHHPASDERRARVRRGRTAGARADEQPDRPQYLATDTHWRPEAMERAAEKLAAYVREVAVAAGRGARRATAARSGRASRTAATSPLMLKLPRGRRDLPARAGDDPAGADAGRPPVAGRQRVGRAVPRRQLLQHLLARLDGLGRRRRVRRAVELCSSAAGGPDRAQRRRRVRHAADARPGTGQGPRPAGRQARGDLGVRRARTGRGRLDGGSA